MKLKTKLISFMILIVIMLSSAYSLGITPSRKVVDFTADLQQEMSFTVMNSEHKEMDLAVYPKGELADYVLVEKNVLHISADQAEAMVRYKVNVPYSVRKPGSNLIEIVVEESPSDYEKQTVVGGRIAVVHQLILKSPYDGSYASLIFTINNPGMYDNVEFYYSLFNEGTKDIDRISAELEILNTKFELITTKKYELGSLGVAERRKESRILDEKLPPGNYYAKTKVLYEGKILSEEIPFVVGGPLIEIESISSSNFKLGQINKMDIAIYNRWAEQIKNVFADVTINDDNKIYGIFKTLSVDIQPFTGNNLFGYWDTSSMQIGNFQAKVSVNYGDKKSEKEFDIQVTPNEFKSLQISGSAVAVKPKASDSAMSFLILGFIALMIVNVLLITYLRRRNQPPQMPSYLFFF